MGLCQAGRINVRLNLSQQAMSKNSITIDGHRIEISRPDKVLFPQSGITKGELVEYYRRIARTMLPHLKDRMVTMRRFPDGIGEEGFYQREIADYFPGWIDRHHSRGVAEPVTSPVINSPAALVYLANLAVITPHVWLSRVDKLKKPDRMIFDLDPGGEDIKALLSVARTLRDELKKHDLPSFVQTTGSRGYHVVVPIKRRYSFNRARSAAGRIARAVAARDNHATTAVRKAKRRGRVYVDIQRNALAQSAVAPYAVRAGEDAPVAAPIDWEELGDTLPRTYTIKKIFRRLGQKNDPWRDIDSQAASLAQP